jgi:hypothetical protein
VSPAEPLLPKEKLSVEIMGIFYILFRVLVLLFAAGFCLVTLNNLPKDISDIVNAIRERDTRELPGALGVAFSCWAITAVLAWQIVVPEVMNMIHGWKSCVEFLRGF